MPPRASQKRKTDDSPYGLSGVKRIPGGNGSAPHGNYSGREQRERDSYGQSAAGRERDWYDKYGTTSGYDKDILGTSASNNSHKRRKLDVGNGAYQPVANSPITRGEEGPLIVFDMATLPMPALLKYLQTYNLAATINPSPLSAQYPISPRDSLLKAASSGSQPRGRQYGKFGQNAWDEMEMQESGVKSNIARSSSTKTPNGPTNMYATTSALGLSATTTEVPDVIDTTSISDVGETHSSLVTIAQTHWNSVSSTYSLNYGGGTTSSRLNEKDVLDEFMNALRYRDLYLRLST
ncbi:hypothetical protein FRB91_010043 [Serendipita sp. 411]|nr:hypothetical protein FRC16_001392 [Serendipita sp. 398]KAG8825767.1 hypothetical protein FRC19_010531 [Serendipita sp. 401]KAG8858291.1 hypothetical protein FRB91_010043 [Serendipita sp. 411]KAG9056072.1 hypothetical protein FS842_000362 [Serendipita sp. 407]